MHQRMQLALCTMQSNVQRSCTHMAVGAPQHEQTKRTCRCMRCFGAAKMAPQSRQIVCTSFSVTVQAHKQAELAQLRSAEEAKIAGAVLDKFSAEQRERGEVASLHERHETLRECAPSQLACLRTLAAGACPSM